MEEYLLQHNVTMSDFWILVVLWILGIVVLFFMWRATIKLYMVEKKCNYFHNYLTWIGSIVISGVFIPVLMMGAWHFINMVTTLLWNFDLY
jgi:hypothetical protein